MDALGININYLIMQILLLLFLVTTMSALLWNPLIKALDERKTRIAKGLEDARNAEENLKSASADASKILADANAQAAKIRSEAQNSADATRKSLEADAQASASAILAKANVDAEERRNGALGDMRGQIASIAIAAANSIVGESLDEKRQHALINDFFSKVPESVSSLSGSTAEIISALPLNDKEQAAAAKSVKANKITYKVDPSILGGLIVKVGDQVVDNSVASQMNGLRNSLK